MGGTRLQPLDAWLDDSELPAERQRNLSLVQVFFGDRMPPRRAEELLDSSERAARAWRDRLVELVDSLADRRESRFRRATAMYGVEQMEAKLRWLDQVRPMLLDGRTDARSATRAGARPRRRERS